MKCDCCKNSLNPISTYRDGNLTYCLSCVKIFMNYIKLIGNTVNTVKILFFYQTFMDLVNLKQIVKINLKLVYLIYVKTV